MSVAKKMDPKVLRDHPANAGLYGRIELSDGIVESITQNGVMQPIIVAPFGDHYYVVSGHRRRDAAMLVGLEEVPVQIREYPSLAAAERDVIALNLFREKTDRIYAAEGEALIAIHSVEAEERMKSGASSNDWTRGRTDDKVADMLGISRSRLRNAITVFGDRYRDERIAELDLLVTRQRGIIRAWDSIRRERLADDYPLTSAVSRVRSLLTAAGKRAPSKPKVRTVTWSTRWTERAPGGEYFAKGVVPLPEGGELILATHDDKPVLLVGDRIAELDLEFLQSLSTTTTEEE